MKKWWNKNSENLTYCSYKVNQTEVLVGPRLDSEMRGCDQKFFDSVNGWLVVTESYIEYPIAANVRWFPWKEHMEPLPDHVVFGSMKILNYWINELKLPKIYIHCDLGTHRAPTVLGAFLLGYYPDQFDEIEKQRTIFNRKVSTIIGADGKEHGDPRSYINSYLKEIPLLETMIKTIVKYPKLDLQGVIRQAFTDRPLSQYTEDEIKEYDQNQKEILYHKRIKQWLKDDLGFQLDSSLTYYTLHDIIDPNGNGTYLVSDLFRLDIFKSLKKYGQVYFSHNNANISNIDLGNFKVEETMNLKKDDLCLVQWKLIKD